MFCAQQFSLYICVGVWEKQSERMNEMSRGTKKEVQNIYEVQH